MSEDPSSSEEARPGVFARVSAFFTGIGGVLTAVAAILTAAVTIAGLVVKDGGESESTQPGDLIRGTSASVGAWAERTDELLYNAARLKTQTEEIRKEFARCVQDRGPEFTDAYYYNRNTLIAQIKANTPPNPVVGVQADLLTAINAELNADSDRYTEMLFDISESRDDM